MYKIISIIVATLFFACFVSYSQESLKSTEEEYYDFLSLEGLVRRPSLNYRTLSDSVWNFTEDGADSQKNVWKAGGENGVNLGKRRILFAPGEKSAGGYLRGVNQDIALKIYGPEWFNSYNTAAPYGQNDGALWQGKGYNTSFSAGARIEAYGFSLTFKPQISFSQNLEFEYIDGVCGDSHSYFWGGCIDLVQRFGDSSFWNFDWGDTEVRYAWHTLTVGFGFQTPWLGPAWLNPMLGSNNAPSYPKIDLGLRRTEVHLPWLGWYIGDIEARAWIGMLTESDYFKVAGTDHKRMLNALSVAYAPSFIPGFTIGLNRIFITKWSLEKLSYFGRLFTTSHSNGTGGDDEDQKFSVFADLFYPQVGLEVYGEIGIDDFTSDEGSNPFHTAIYTVGAKKTIPICDKYGVRGEIIFEWNNFEMSQDFQLQWSYMGYYAHGKIAQGYTQQGQIIGAGSGYAGNSQFLGFKVYYPKGSVMLFYHRSCPDNNYIYNKAINEDASYGSDINKNFYAQYKTYKTFGINANYFVTANLNVYGGVAYTRIYHEYWNNKAESIKNNFRFEFGGKYQF